MSNIKVTKRNGKKEPLILDKILERINQQTYGLDQNYVIPFEVAQKVIDGIYPDIETRMLDQLAMETSATLATKHYDYGVLAARIAVTSLHKETSRSFSETVAKLYNYVNPRNGKHSPIVSKEFNDLVQKNKTALDSAIIHSRDNLFDYFGFKVLEKSYLLKINGRIAERPQYLFMRTALQIHGENIDKAIETYNMLSNGEYTHATPTLFNSGTTKPQLSSCFLLDTTDDSIVGIFDTVHKCAIISQHAGGIGLAFSNVRGSGSYISGTNGESNGIIPFLKVLNETARAVDQGGGKRKGSFAIYLEPWHTDIMEFLDIRKNQGKDEIRARDLFTAMWINDVFMERVHLDQDWTLMCPNEANGLQDAYGDDFRALYERYEREGKGKKVVKARAVWEKILSSQIETGTPYMLYKDVVNERNNQENLGTIRSSNLCAEILEKSGVSKWQKENFSEDKWVHEIAVCNLASICLPKFVNKNKSYNFNKLYEVAYAAASNLNRIIDSNYYPLPEAKFSNESHRPIGLGVQGLADVFFIMGIPFDSEKAKEINRDIFETIYYAALKASNDAAKVEGVYPSYEGSPISKGQFQFDLWSVKPSKRWGWEKLREDILEHGVRNSLLVAVMPTASTSSIFGNEACIEPQTSNMYSRRVLAGEFILVNKHLIRELIKLKLWGEEMRIKIMNENGSIQNIPEIPTEIKAIYKTAYEIKQKDLIDMAADRGAYIDQTQSLNIFMDKPNYAKLTSMHFYGWGLRQFERDVNNKPIIPTGEHIRLICDSDGTPKAYRDLTKSLKTGMYYLRSNGTSDAVKFTTQTEVATDNISCSLDNPDECIACSA